MTIRDLLNGTSEIQGSVIVRQWNEDREDYDIESDLWKLNSRNDILDKRIKYLYASINPNLDIEKPALIIEVESDED